MTYDERSMLAPDPEHSVKKSEQRKPHDIHEISHEQSELIKQRKHFDDEYAKRIDRAITEDHRQMSNIKEDSVTEWLENLIDRITDGDVEAEKTYLEFMADHPIQSKQGFVKPEEERIRQLASLNEELRDREAHPQGELARSHGAWKDHNDLIKARIAELSHPDYPSQARTAPYGWKQEQSYRGYAGFENPESYNLLSQPWYPLPRAQIPGPVPMSNPERYRDTSDSRTSRYLDRELGPKSNLPIDWRRYKGLDFRDRAKEVWKQELIAQALAPFVRFDQNATNASSYLAEQGYGNIHERGHPDSSMPSDQFGESAMFKPEAWSPIDQLYPPRIPDKEIFYQEHPEGKRLMADWDSASKIHEDQDNQFHSENFEKAFGRKYEDYAVPQREQYMGRSFYGAKNGTGGGATEDDDKAYGIWLDKHKNSFEPNYLAGKKASDDAYDAYKKGWKDYMETQIPSTQWPELNRNVWDWSLQPYSAESKNRYAYRDKEWPDMSSYNPLGGSGEAATDLWDVVGTDPATREQHAYRFKAPYEAKENLPDEHYLGDRPYFHYPRTSDKGEGWGPVKSAGRYIDVALGQKDKRVLEDERMWGGKNRERRGPLSERDILYSHLPSLTRPEREIKAKKVQDERQVKRAEELAWEPFEVLNPFSDHTLREKIWRGATWPYKAGLWALDEAFGDPTEEDYEEAGPESILRNDDAGGL